MKRSTRECAKSSICFKADLFSTTHNHTIIRCNQRVAKTKTRQSSLNKTDLKKNAVAKRRTSEHLQNKNIERKKKWKIFPECKFSTIDHKFFLNNPLMFWHSNKKRKHRYHFQPSLKTRFDNTMPPPFFFSFQYAYTHSRDHLPILIPFEIPRQWNTPTDPTTINGQTSLDKKRFQKYLQNFQP